MRSSTFNSDRTCAAVTDGAVAVLTRAAIGKPSVWLLTICVGWLIFLETITAVGFHRLSKTQYRIYREYHAALSDDHRNLDEKPELILVGNSLLNEGVGVAQLTKSMRAKWQVKRLVVESTNYLDWYYGLRRLLSDGARPNVICVMLNWRQLMVSEVRGEYFAHYLMLTRDFFSVAQELKLHLTPATNFFAGHFSAFYGARVEIRKIILGELLPDLPALTRLITPTADTPSEENSQQKLIGRLRALKAMTMAYGIPLVLIVPPAMADLQAKQLKQAGDTAGVPVVVGWSSRDFSLADFSDGFHLNNQGAERYTKMLASELTEVLDDLSAQQKMNNVPQRQSSANPR
jgi:hypothetical protein